MIERRVKRGESLRLGLRRAGGLAGVTISAAMTGPARVPLAVSVTNPVRGDFELSHPDTRALPTGRYTVAVRYTEGGQTRAAPAFVLHLLEAITP
jgi:hypothetical protein